jgi:hypothetical protein
MLAKDKHSYKVGIVAESAYDHQRDQKEISLDYSEWFLSRLDDAL